MRVECRSAIVPTTPCGARPSLHSPQPVMPSSVSTFTNVQGRQPASTINVSILVIFIAFLSPILASIPLCNRHRGGTQRWHNLVRLKRTDVFLIDLDAMWPAVCHIHPTERVDTYRHRPVEQFLWLQVGHLAQA